MLSRLLPTIIILILFSFSANVFGQTVGLVKGETKKDQGVAESFSQDMRIFSGVVVTGQFELVPGVEIEVETSGEILKTKTDSEGRFSLKSSI